MYKKGGGIQKLLKHSMMTITIRTTFNAIIYNANICNIPNCKIASNKYVYKTQETTTSLSRIRKTDSYW